jgi:hypothetical protein
VSGFFGKAGRGFGRLIKLALSLVLFESHSAAIVAGGGRPDQSS